MFGHFFGYEVDSLFITALLTVMGFSVHDTIVVFDRIRENLRKFPSKEFDTNVNDSVVQTLARSLNTSMTLIIVLLTLVIIGGASIRPFVSTLLVGVTIGTFSSIFNASLLLAVWQNFSMKKLAKKTA
jgi:preprotein translocase subunit SecF